MEADSFSLKLTLSVFAKDDKVSCPSWMNLSSTPMYLFCRAMLSRLASASCRAFSFVSFSLRASTLWQALHISPLCQEQLSPVVPLQEPPCSYACVLVPLPLKVHHRRSLLPSHTYALPCCNSQYAVGTNIVTYPSGQDSLSLLLIIISYG